MPDIKYVCLSDLHLGEEDSLLTNIDKAGNPKFDKPSPVMRKLFDCIRLLIDKNENKDKEERPTLVLCGDILELALAFMN
ncbi:MAG: phosphoesterase, partial [Deltaproteobacteria bacterium]|nr:phosphoesterase [Deltaproteobacteria bacterium]